MSIFEGKKRTPFKRTVNLDQQWGPTDCNSVANYDHFRAIQRELDAGYRERNGEVMVNDPKPGKGNPVKNLPNAGKNFI